MHLYTSSEIAPASSTPVGPPPTIMIVISAFFKSLSFSTREARSNVRIR